MAKLKSDDLALPRNLQSSGDVALPRNVYTEAANTYNPMPQVTNRQTSVSSPTALAGVKAIENRYGQPQQNTAGISAATGAPQSNTVSAPEGMIGLRSGLNGRGIDNIGWDDANKTVTVDGRSVWKPDTIVDGTSYVTEQDLNKITNDVYRSQGRELTGNINDYAARAGISNAVKWSDGQLSIGGKQVPIVYVDSDGTAYAERSVVDNAINEYKQSAGITGNQEVYDDWSSRYGSKIRSALNDILSRDKWSYDPEKDAAYQAYRDMYTREGNRAFQNAYGDAAALTGGYGSSAAMSAAGQQMNYYMQQMGDRIPELMQNDYSRYLGEQQLRQQALDSITGVADSDYNKAYQANRDAVTDTNTANYYSYLRDKDARDYNRDVYTGDRDYDRDKEVSDREWAVQEPYYRDRNTQSSIDTANYEENAALDLRAKRTETEMAELESILTKEMYRADPNRPISDADATVLGLPKKEDGTNYSIMEIQLGKATLEAAANLAGWQNYGIKELEDTLKLQTQYSVEEMIQKLQAQMSLGQ